MAWVVLFIAGIFEVVWAVGLKYTQGFTRLWPGVGTVGTAVVGMTIQDEPRGVGRLVCVALIVACIVGLKLFSPH